MRNTFFTGWLYLLNSKLFDAVVIRIAEVEVKSAGVHAEVGGSGSATLV